MITSIPITIDLTKAYLPHINLVQEESAGRRLSFTFVSGGAAVDLTGKIIILVGVKPSGLVVTSALTITAATSGKAYTDVLTQMVAEVGALSLQIRIFTPGITGTATSGGATYLYDTSKSWTAGAYVGQWLYISSGTGAGQARRITANTATQLTISDAWGTNPAAGSGYAIVYETGYSFPFAATVAASPNADAAIVSSSDFSALTAALATAAGLDATVVHKAGAETITGVKTFVSSPIVPTPTTDMQASTKKYADDLVANIGTKYTAIQSANINFSGSEVLVMSLVLPAGTYVIQSLFDHLYVSGCTKFRLSTGGLIGGKGFIGRVETFVTTTTINAYATAGSGTAYADADRGYLHAVRIK